MSYSFTARGKTKAEALAAVGAELDRVIIGQPIHAVDREPALAAVAAFVNVLPDNADKEVSVSVSGSLSWTGIHPNSHVINQAQVNVNASLK